MNMEAAKEVYHSYNEASCIDNSEDDWEAVADRAPDELLSSECLPDVSKLLLEDIKVQTPVRRGRGAFSYQKHGLYSDQQSSGPVEDNSKNQSTPPSFVEHEQTRDLKYGTRHALVLEDFPPSMTTSGLENMLEKFNYHDVVVRWINDTTALAVFRTPSLVTPTRTRPPCRRHSFSINHQGPTTTPFLMKKLVLNENISKTGLTKFATSSPKAEGVMADLNGALEACRSIKCPFTVRVLDENDVLLTSIPERDLEPPRQRPKTSARTAQRLIAHGMGMKLGSTSFGQKELKEQEAARRQRILSRQTMKDNAWGD